MDLSWVISYMYGIDLRGAVLTNLHLSNLDDVGHAYLQCAELRNAILKGAHLEHANLRGADLTGAHLEGAYLAGADLQGANVTGADFSGAMGLEPEKLKHVYGSAKGLPPGVAPSTIKPPNLSSCLADESYGNPPRGNLSPTFSPSATPSPSPTSST